MRKPLAPYRGPNAFNYLCLLATDLLGEPNLRRIPALLAGFDGVLSTLSPAAARAVRNLRLSGNAPTTIRELRLRVDEYQQYHERRDRMRRSAQDADIEEAEESFDQRFLISNDLAVQKRWSQIVPEDVREALQSLTNRLPPRAATQLPSHDPQREAAMGARNALERVWDRAAKSVAFRSNPAVGDSDEVEQDPDESDDLEHVLEEASRLAAVELDTMRSFYEQLQRALEVWDRDGTESSLKNVARALRSAPRLKWVVSTSMSVFLRAVVPLAASRGRNETSHP